MGEQGGKKIVTGFSLEAPKELHDVGQSIFLPWLAAAPCPVPPPHRESQGAGFSSLHRPWGATGRMSKK